MPLVRRMKMLLKIAPSDVPPATGTAVEMSVHAEPFHCSIKRPDP